MKKLISFLLFLVSINNIFAENLPTIKTPLYVPVGPLSEVIGQDKIKIEGEVNLQTSEYKLSSIPRRERIGILVVDKFTISLSSRSGFTISGKTKLLQKDAKISLNALNDNEASLKISFDKNNLPSANIMGETVTIPSLQATIKRGEKQVAIKTIVNVLNKDVEVLLEVQDGKQTLRAGLDYITLGEIQKTDPQIDKIRIEKPSITYSRDNQEQVITVYGYSDLSQNIPKPILDISPGLKKAAKKLEVKLSASTSGGVSMTTSLPKVNLPILGKLKNPVLKIKKVFKRKNQESNLTALSRISNAMYALGSYVGIKLAYNNNNPTLNFPLLQRPALVLSQNEVIDINEEETTEIEEAQADETHSLTIEGEATYKPAESKEPMVFKTAVRISGKLFEISGFLTKKVNVQRVEIDNPGFTISQNPTILRIFGNTVIPGAKNLNITGGLEFNFGNVKPGDKADKYSLTLMGRLTDTKPYSPFPNIQGLQDLKFEAGEIRATIAGKDEEKEALDAAESDKDIILSFAIEGTVDYKGVKNQGTLKAIATKESLAKNRFGVAVSFELPSGLRVSDVVSQIKGSPVEVLNISDVKMFASSMEYNEPLVDSTEIERGFNLSMVARDINAVLLKIPEARLTGAIGPNSFSFSTAVPTEIKITDATTFKSIEFVIERSQGKLAEMFLKGVLDAQVGSDMLKFTGAMKINPLEGNLGVSMSMQEYWNNPFNIQRLKVGNLGVQGVLATPILASQLGFNGEVEMGTKKVTLGFNATLNPKDAFLYGKLNYLSSQDFFDTVIKMGKRPIKTKNFPKISLKDVEVLIAPTGGYVGEFSYDAGYTIAGDLDFLNWKGKVKGNISDNGLILKGNMDPIRFGQLLTVSAPNQKTKGPVVDAELSLFKQKFYISGSTTILGLTRSVIMDVTPGKIYFETEGKILDFINAKVKAEISNPSNPVIYTEAILGQEFEAFVREQINNEAQKGVSSAIARVDAKISAIKQKHVIPLEKLSKAQNKVDKINNDIVKLNDKIRNVNNKIAREKEYFASLPKVSAKKPSRASMSVKHAANMTAYGSELASYKTAKGTLIASRESAKGVLEGAKLAVKDLDPKLNSLRAKKAALRGGALVVKGSTIALSEAMKTFSIRKARIKADLADLKMGKLPLLEFTITLAGATHTIPLQFDVKRPGEALINKIKTTFS